MARRSNAMTGRTVSVVVPVWNEVESLPAVFEALEHLSRDLRTAGLSLEVVITDNASTDGSWDYITGNVSHLEDAKAFQFTRNYGFQESILFALSKASGDCAAVLQSDLQDPPELIPQFVERWSTGALAVAGRASSRPDGWSMTIARKLFYALANGSSESTVERGVQDFYLLDRRVIDDIVRSKPPMQLLRTYVSEHFGFAETIDYARRPRASGQPALSMSDYYQLALDGLLMSGGKAIRHLTIASFVLAFAAIALVVTLVAAYATGWRPGAPGWLSLVVALLFLFSALGTTSGIALEYLRRIARLGQPGPKAQCWQQTGSHIDTVTASAPRPWEGI